MINTIEQFLDFRRDKLYFYSPYTFLREHSPEIIYNETVKKPIIDAFEKDEVHYMEINTAGEQHFFIYKKLKWDSEYFGFLTYKLLLIAFKHNNYTILRNSILEFVRIIKSNEKVHYYIEIPSEENILIQALGEAGFRLVETRLNMYIDKIPTYTTERYKVRRAELSDIPNLRRVAAEMRNPYDRAHSDIVYNDEIADNYLADYVEQSVKGFTDLVIVPAEEGVPPDAFLTINYPTDILGKKIAKLLVIAASSRTCKGWAKKLNLEGIIRLKEMGTDYVLVNTQSSNKQSVQNLLHKGFLLSGVTHVFSVSNFSMR